MHCEETAKQFVESTMHPPPQKFVMISKAYSEGISLWEDGPKITREFRSECVLGDSKTFRTAATFVPKLIPKNFITTLRVADELTYYEYIEFERRTVMTNFSETANVFLPKEKINTFCSTLLFDPNGTGNSYISGIELLPARKILVTSEKSNFQDDSTDCVEKRMVNGDVIHQQLVNGRR